MHEMYGEVCEKCRKKLEKDHELYVRYPELDDIIKRSELIYENRILFITSNVAKVVFKKLIGRWPNSISDVK